MFNFKQSEGASNNKQCYKLIVPFSDTASLNQNNIQSTSARKKVTHTQQHIVLHRVLYIQGKIMNTDQHLLHTKGFGSNNSHNFRLTSSNVFVFVLSRKSGRKTILALRVFRCYKHNNQHVCLSRVACLDVFRGEWLSRGNAFRHYKGIGLNHNQRLQRRSLLPKCIVYCLKNISALSMLLLK